ncbi:DUF6228 family protein [Streptomyces sp. NPDC017988]|uniref:DUF6228 family protein n=1 Tax=Streptomyces sp. NPDC017988 TaxID=3365025 RepID=UPI003792CD8D
MLFWGVDGDVNEPPSQRRELIVGLLVRYTNGLSASRPEFKDNYEDWKCTVTTVIEAGEGMTVVAADLKAFLAQG